MERKLGTTSMKMSIRTDGSGITDWVAFKLDGDYVLNCTIGVHFGLGGSLTVIHNTTCRNITGVPGVTNFVLKKTCLVESVQLGKKSDQKASGGGWW